MPEFLLQLDTDKVEFTGEKLGEETCTSVVKIKNTQKEKYLYKIKCTSNELFRIRPPLGYIKPGEAEAVKLIFNSGKPVPESGKHYFVVYYRKADGDKAPRNAWQGKEPEAMKRLYINFSKKKEEKKEEEKKEEKKEESKKEEKKEEEKKEEEKKEEKKEEEKKEEKKEEEKKEEKKEEEKKEEKKEEEKKEEKKEEEKKEEKKEEEKKEEKKEEEKKEEKKEEEKKE
ncbi:hypothetical protein PRIPAC_94589 [Pristionchus pacificus]|uniref:Major sperm protein n=2 Tax=Pristionchus pacificus TaxID=54126 RepID=A0A454Y327_PRIPA|nr:hypothetical protein PRIPAC_94589 [Pristionchus pacificus]|eukprot:PDM63274.1 MSP domain-containing protein [Pristionchus pacificus]